LAGCVKGFNNSKKSLLLLKCDLYGLFLIRGYAQKFTSGEKVKVKNKSKDFGFWPKPGLS
jgi:hypothetical protein